MPIVLDLTHTAHTRARTGVQRVCRSLRRALGGRASAVCFDPYERAWRPLEASEAAGLEADAASAGRGARWSVGARLRGSLRRLSGRRRPPLAGAGEPTGTLVPEIFSARVGSSLPELFSLAPGPRAALFHDALALQFPELSPRSTVARFAGYLKELLRFDGVAAVSETSRQALLGYWAWLGVAEPPPVAALPLGIDPAPPPLAVPAGPPVILCVGSIEARKNHLALLEACEALWRQGFGFTLHLVGLANAETGAAALRRIGQLRAAGRPVRYDGPLPDAGLEAAYRACTFTVYPSLAEGFGLPVAESLARGRPCACLDTGAVGEISRGGGCVSLGSGTAAGIALALASLLRDRPGLEALAAAAAARKFKDWDAYAHQLLAWMEALPPRARP